MAACPSFRIFSRRAAASCGGFAGLLDGILDGLDGKKLEKQIVETLELASFLSKEGYRVDMPRDADETYDKILSVLNAELMKAMRQVSMERMGLRAVQTLGIRSSQSKVDSSPTMGFLERRMHCLGCRHSADLKIETFNRVSLSMPKEGTPEIDLVSCLAEFSGQEELLDGVQCSRCHRKGQHLLSYSVSRFPKVLCIQLKRLKWDARSGSPVRDNRPARTALSIPLSALCKTIAVNEEKPQEYRLRAVVLHLDKAGRSGGHYTCYRFVPQVVENGFASLVPGLPRDSGSWYYVNDDTVSHASIQNDEIIGSAYMFFYELIGKSSIKNWWLRPP